LEDFRSIGARLSNWGRWGADDERGTLNLLTPERIAAAAALVRSGKVFDLGIPFDWDGPQDGRVRPNPVRTMKETGTTQHYPGAFRYADDYVFMALQAASQWDAVAHVFYDEQLYNGFPSSSVSVNGAARCSVDRLSPGVVGRGVLLDVPRLRGERWLEAGEAITPDDLDQAVAAQQVDIFAGDILLVRTGWRRMFLEHRDAGAFKAGEPGLSVRCADWLHEHEIAAIASDNFAVEVIPSEFEDEVFPLHMILLRDMGMPLGEILDFEELAADCAQDGVYEFQFCAPPIKFARGVGSPINPLALK